MTPGPHLRGRVFTANVYRERPQGPWHASRWEAEQTARVVERHTQQRVAYRVVARMK